MSDHDRGIVAATDRRLLKWLFGRSSNNLFIESADDLTVFIEPIDDLTNVAFVAYHDMSTHVDGNELVWGIDVENQSMAEDLGLKKACIRNIMFLDAAGRVIDEGEEDDPCFDWEDRSILPPAFRVSGTVKVRLPQDAGEVKYVAGQFDLPGIGAHWRLLPVPTAAGARP